MRRRSLALALLLLPAAGRAQIDPERRRMVQVGYDRPLSGQGPIGAYGFLYANQPRFVRDDFTLRLAVAPTYIDSELGIRDFARRTDAGLGLAGGGFAESYSEVRKGQFFREESFDGHGLSATGSLYPKISPDSWVIPVGLVLRAGAHTKWYNTNKYTSRSFAPPPDHVDYRFRAGVRIGGSPPEVRPRRAAELSFWYQGYLRDRHGRYGFAGDRPLERRTHLFWTRALVAWRQESGRHLRAAVEAGGSSTPDRINAYRLGGLLPFASEFPLSLPGYFNGELSARRYVLAGTDYLIPLGDTNRWATHVFANSANVTFLRGMDQPGPWNHGVGTGASYVSKGGALGVEVNYAYGINAIRAGGRGAHSVSLVAQIDLVAWKRVDPDRRPARRTPSKPEGLDWLFRMFQP